MIYDEYVCTRIYLYIMTFSFYNTILRFFNQLEVLILQAHHRLLNTPALRLRS